MDWEKVKEKLGLTELVSGLSGLATSLFAYVQIEMSIYKIVFGIIGVALLVVCVLCLLVMVPCFCNKSFRFHKINIHSKFFRGAVVYFILILAIVVFMKQETDVHDLETGIIDVSGELVSAEKQTHITDFFGDSGWEEIKRNAIPISFWENSIQHVSYQQNRIIAWKVQAYKDGQLEIRMSWHQEDPYTGKEISGWDTPSGSIEGWRVFLVNENGEIKDKRNFKRSDGVDIVDCKSAENEYYYAVLECLINDGTYWHFVTMAKA